MLSSLFHQAATVQKYLRALNMADGFIFNV